MPDTASDDHRRSEEAGERQDGRNEGADGRPDGWTTERDDRQDGLLTRYRFVPVGAASGLVGGMGAFMFDRVALIPRIVPLLPARLWSLVATALGGSFAFFLARDTLEGVKAMLVGLGIAVLTLTVSRLFPIWWLYPPAAWGLLVKYHMRFVVRTIFVVLLVVYWGGYLATLSVWGYFWS